MDKLTYGKQKELPNVSYGDAIAKVKEALKAEGFGVLTEIDVKKTLKEKIDVDFRPYVILGACNPPLAHRALSAETHIGLMLPCNVVVQERPGGGSTVSVQDPMRTIGMVGNPALDGPAKEATEKLRRVLARL